MIADYTSERLDLSDPATYRDLSRPIGALDQKRLAFFRERFESLQVSIALLAPKRAPNSPYHPFFQPST